MSKELKIAASGIGCAWVLWMLAVMGFWCAAIYVVTHFVLKFW